MGGEALWALINAMSVDAFRDKDKVMIDLDEVCLCVNYAIGASWFVLALLQNKRGGAGKDEWSSDNRACNRKSLVVAWARARYSDAALEQGTAFCLKDDREAELGVRKAQLPLALRQSSMQPTQSMLVKWVK